MIHFSNKSFWGGFTYCLGRGSQEKLHHRRMTKPTEVKGGKNIMILFAVFKLLSLRRNGELFSLSHQWQAKRSPVDYIKFLDICEKIQCHLIVELCKHWYITKPCCFQHCLCVPLQQTLAVPFKKELYLIQSQREIIYIFDVPII